MWPETWIWSPIVRLTCKWFLTSSKYMNIWSSRTNFRLKLTTTKDFNTEEGPLKMRWEGLTWFFGCHTGSWDPHTHTGRDRKWSFDVPLCCSETWTNHTSFCSGTIGSILRVSIVLLAWNPVLQGQVVLTSCQGPRGVRACVSSLLLWLESWIWSSFWLCSVTHTQHQTRDKTVRVRVSLQSRFDQLNHSPETALYLVRCRETQVEVNRGWPEDLVGVCSPSEDFTQCLL